MRRLFLVTVVIISFAITPLANGATVPDEQFVVQPPVPVGQEFFGYTRAYLDESFALGTWSTLIGKNYQDNDPRKKEISGEICSSLDAPNCKNVNGFQYYATLDVCEKNSDTNCIEGLSASIKNGPFIKGIVVEKTTPNFKYGFVGNPGQGVPNGATPALWKFDSIKHQGGDLFLLNVVAEKNSAGSGTLYPERLIAALQPISKKIGSFTIPYAVGLKTPNAMGNVWGIDNGKFGECVRILSETECALPWPHPDEIRYRLELRVSKSANLSNFLHGRVVNPMVTLTSLNNNQFSMVIEAGPVSTPFINAWRKNTDISPELNKILDKQFYGGGGYEGNCTSAGRPSCNFIIPPIELNETGREQYLLWLKEFGDRASGVKSMWSIRTLDQNALTSTYGPTECIVNLKGMSGVVSTNANVYVAGPPTFNSKTGTLDYKVSSPHFDAQGNVNKGSYDLAISEDLARCIYGFSKAPIKAEVSVFGENGEKKVATTTVLQRDGWIYLSAQGFEYSVPTLSVKLSQDKEIEVAPSIKPTSSSRVITCTKGKISKKISGTNPKCPAGYKKK